MVLICSSTDTSLCRLPSNLEYGYGIREVISTAADLPLKYQGPGLRFVRPGSLFLQTLGRSYEQYYFSKYGKAWRMS